MKNRILDGGKHEPDVGGIRGLGQTGHSSVPAMLGGLGGGMERLLRIKVEVGPIDLIETPQQIFRRSIDIIASRVVGKIIPQRRSTQFLFEEIHFVEEEDNAGAHEPARIHHRVEQDQTFHHSVLSAVIRDAGGTGSRDHT